MIGKDISKLQAKAYSPKNIINLRTDFTVKRLERSGGSHGSKGTFINCTWISYKP